jgi:hypothetical protein
MQIKLNELTPRTQLYQESFKDKKPLTKEKINQIFIETIEYFKKEMEEVKSEKKKHEKL